jgi:very-short-patch-repair endonuclease
VPASVLERRLLHVLKSAGLPSPVGQHRVERPDGSASYLDFAYVDSRLGIEVDGHATHATRTQRAADADRTNQLSLLGWQVLRFTYEDVTRRPTRVAATIRDALRSRPCRVTRPRSGPGATSSRS